jgi:hypothetical protein
MFEESLAARRIGIRRRPVPIAVAASDTSTATNNDVVTGRRRALVPEKSRLRSSSFSRAQSRSRQLIETPSSGPCTHHRVVVGR